MRKKPGPKPAPRRPREVLEEYAEESEVNYIYRHIVVALILFGLATLFYLAHSHQAGLLGEWFLTNSHLFLGSVGFYITPALLIGTGIVYLLYRRDPVPLHVPVGSLMIGIGTLTALYTINPVTGWSGFMGSVIGNPLLVGSGTYISTLLAAALTVAGVAVLPRGRSMLEHAGLLVERGAGAVVSGAGTLLRRRRADGTIEEIYEDGAVAEPESDEEYYEEEDQVEEQETSTPHIRLQRREQHEEAKAVDPTPRKPQLPASPYIPPPLNLLAVAGGKANAGDIQHNAGVLKQTLANFNINVDMDAISTGPSITRYTMKPAQGLKLSRILQLRNELSLALAAHPIRIEAPVPGTSLVGIEIPNKVVAKVGLRSLFEDEQFTKSPNALQVALGKGVSGKGYYANLAKIPHLMIAGTTGSGKSVMIQNLILSLIYRNGPDNLKLIMVDPKRVELTLYNGIPHLLTPVIKEAKKAIIALRWAAKEMDRRYGVLEKAGVRDIGSYHQSIAFPAYEEAEKIRAKNPDEAAELELPERMPYIVIVIDELADIMQAYPRELEAGIVRLAQMSRAVGIHLIISTQRPSVNVITGLIKANIPGRLALRVASQIDSRTILDTPGAESLMGNGDTLFMGEGMNKPERLQGGFVSEDEIKKIVANIISNNRGFPPELIDIGDQVTTEGAIVSEYYGDSAGADTEDDDDMYPEAKELVIKTRVASTSFIQRKLRVGYSRAARLIDILEERGVVGPSQGSKPREVLLGGNTEHEYEEETETES